VKLILLILALLLTSCSSSLRRESVQSKQSRKKEYCIQKSLVLNPELEKVESVAAIKISGKNIVKLIKSERDVSKECSNFLFANHDDSYLALPGFINTHTHLWQHLNRGLGSNEQLQSWIPKIYPNSFHLSDKEYFLINKLAATDAIEHGFTTVLDWTINFGSNKPYFLQKAFSESGLGGGIAWIYPSVFLPREQANLEYSRLRVLGKKNNLNIWLAFGPPESQNSPVLFDGIDFANHNEIPMTEHVVENLTNITDWLVNQKGYLKDHGLKLSKIDFKALNRNILQIEHSLRKSASSDAVWQLSKYHSILNKKLKTVSSYIPWLKHLGAFKQPFIGIHSVWLSEEDLNIYHSNNATISYCPESNAYLRSGIAPIVRALTKGINVSIATDGAASNDRIDPFSAMRTAAFLQKILYLGQLNKQVLNSWSILRMATINGAKAMGLDNATGSIIEGKEADIVLIPWSSFSLASAVNKYSNHIANLVVNSLESKDIQYVISDGRLVYNKYMLKQESSSELQRDILKSLQKRVKERGGRRIDQDFKIKKFIRPFYETLFPNDNVKISYKNNSKQVKCLEVVISPDIKANELFLGDNSRKRFPNPISQNNLFRFRYHLKPQKTLKIINNPNQTQLNIQIWQENKRLKNYQAKKALKPKWWSRDNLYFGSCL
jgi:cytosine/adenosine deaminase-related metal-dependent hydrolase